MKKCVPASVLFLLAGCSTSPTSSAGWLDYAPASGKSTVQFPDKPREEEKSHFGTVVRFVVLD
jgi:hypothetical protein